ncbi:MAG: gamma-glutamyl-gamma-aminobutyrate hydrolase family protein [Bacteroidales bacterium]|nr:gamma-glutamyl-gamma-aminobutyrate hydrolase family protein [Bacteroidales bacterium]
MNTRKTSIILAAILLLISIIPAEARRRPVIGIVPGCQGESYSIVSRNYSNAILRAGGIPLILPQVQDPSQASMIVSELDGILFTGGVDIDPSKYGEDVLNDSVEIDAQRDRIDFLYAEAALGRGLPILAICRGEQLMNVVLGGSLYQDLPSQKPSDIAHRQKEDGTVPTHAIAVSPESKLHRIMRSDTLMVNSFHHQAVKVPSPRLTVTALAGDGIVEAYELSSKKQWLVAVQFHPEIQVRADDHWLDLFKAFVKASR